MIRLFREELTRTNEVLTEAYDTILLHDDYDTSVTAARLTA